MASNDHFDLVVIGSGPGGYVAAIRAAQLGMKTACIEKEKTLGGTCLNVGCIPSKALLDSSEHYLHASKGKLTKHGVMVENVKLDLPQMLKRKDDVVRQLTNGVQYLFKKNKIEWIKGSGKLINIQTPTKLIEVDNQGVKTTLTADKIILATGSAPAALPFLPFDEKRVVSSTGALALPTVPKHLVVIGGGVIGLELGSVWKRLGAKVTVIEFQDRILPGMDTQSVQELHKILVKQGMEFLLSTKCLGAQASGEWMVVDIEERATGEKGKIECDTILVATGRRPYTTGLGLEEVGIALDQAGRIPVNDRFETTAKGIYAIGDVIDGPMLAHKAEDEGMVVAEIIAGQHSHVNYNTIPGVVYTWPEFASVGFSEDELKAKSHAYKVGSFPFMINGRAKAMDETEGFVKILSDAKSGIVLGVHIVGPRASDMIAEAVAVMEAHGTAEEIARTCHAHPSLAEVMREAALAVDQRAIHL
ncbi:MAG: dihydrolipoyl dehydrogenase [Bacteriovoracia bacterium]